MFEFTSPVVKSQRDVDGVVVLELAGDIDVVTSDVLRSDLMALADTQPAKLVLNLSGVTYMDSSGVAKLVELMQRLKRQRIELVLCYLVPRVFAIFEIARLDRVFTIAESEAAAIGGTAS